MIRRILSFVEPFILMLLGTVVLASVLPARGEWARVAAAHEGALDLSAGPDGRGLCAQLLLAPMA